MSISVFPGRSVAPSDYFLQVDGIEYPCLGMGSARTQIFDFRFLEKQGPSEILLIFACPAAARGAVLKCAHAEMPIPPITGLVLQEPAPEPAPEPESAGETTEAAPAETVEPAETTPVEK